MKKILFILLCFPLFSVFGVTPGSRWYYPNNIYDEYWDVIDSLVPDTTMERIQEIKDLNALDSVLMGFYNGYHDGSIHTAHGNIYLKGHFFEAHILAGIARMVGIDIGTIFHGMYYFDGVEKLYEWYRYNKEKIDLNILKKLTEADYVYDHVTNYDYISYGLYVFFEQFPKIGDWYQWDNWIETLSDNEKIQMDSIFELYPETEAVKLKFIDDKLYYFIDAHRYLLVNDSVSGQISGPYAR